MAQFRILVTREITESIVVAVEAESLDAAQAIVEDILPDCGKIEDMAAPGHQWEIDSDSAQTGDVYITDAQPLSECVNA